jgi:hypothetical protein
MNEHPQPPSDLALEAQTRAGSDAAWNELRSRHVDALDALARSRTHRGETASVESVFDELRRQIVSPDAPMSSQAPIAGDPQPPIRPRAIGLLTGGTYGPSWNPSATSEHEPVPGPGPDRDQLVELAAAFRQLPTAWQAVLWHRWVERTPAAELTAILGRPAADVVALEQTASRGLVDSHAEVALATNPPAACVPVIGLLGAYRRRALPDAQRRVVDEHLTVVECDACRRRLDVIDRLPAIVPVAVAPGLVGVDVDRYREVIGAAAVLGAAALAARRTARGRRRARIGAIAAIVLALLAAAFFVRSPFGDLDSELADLLERGSTTTTMSTPSTGSSVPDSTDPVGETLPNRIELVFPGAPQGAVYVPGGRALNLGISLSTPGPVYAGATGTIDAAITNNDSEDASVRFLARSSTGVSFERLVRGVGSCIAEPEGAGRCTLSLPAGATAEMSLRFIVAADVPDRLVVVPSISPEVLEVPVEFVDGLLLGQIGRGELFSAGATLGSCVPTPTCPNGRRDASSAPLEVSAEDTIERALLVWEGDRADAGWAGIVGLIPPGSATAVSVSSGNVPAPSGALGTGASVGTSETRAATGFRSVADVTDLVRAAGGGTYTVVRPPGTDEPGDGSWTLTVVTAADSGPSRLFVVVRPDRLVTPDAPLRVDIPIAGSPPPPTTPQRRVELVLQAATAGAGASEVTVNDALVGADDAVATVGETGDTVTYDLEIVSTENALTLVATTSADALRLASVGLTADIVS